MTSIQRLEHNVHLQPWDCYCEQQTKHEIISIIHKFKSNKTLGDGIETENLQMMPTPSKHTEIIFICVKKGVHITWME